MTSFGEIRSAAGTQDKDAFVSSLVALLPPIYDKENPNTLLRKLYEAMAEELLKADILVESVGNNNYLSVEVVDEIIIRSGGTADRLKNENAFELSKVRLHSETATVSQNTILSAGLNELQLFFVPDNPADILVSTLGSLTATRFPTSFDEVTNTLTVLADRAGQFTVTYVDTGDVVRLNENITIPEGLFRLGYSEGGWSELGYSE